MPAPIRWYVRAAMLHIGAAMVLGVFYQVDQVTGRLGLPRYVLVMHTHLALVGRVIQIIMGVALWMFPLTQPVKRRLAHREGIAWLTFVMLNAGLLGRFAAESAFHATGAAAWGALAVVTGFMQVAAFGILLYHAWSLRPSRRAQGGGTA